MILLSRTSQQSYRKNLPNKLHRKIIKQAFEKVSTNASSITQGIQDWYLRGKIEFLLKRLNIHSKKFESQPETDDKRQSYFKLIQTLEKYDLDCLSPKQLALLKCPHLANYAKLLKRYNKIKDIKQRCEIMKRLTKIENSITIPKKYINKDVSFSLICKKKKSSHSKPRPKIRDRSLLYTSFNIKI